VCGDPASISQTLIAAPGIAKVSFTGSVPVGRGLAELSARHLKRFTGELGGHAAAIICEDADPQLAARLAVAAKYRNAGQICAAPIRFLVQRRGYQAFRAEFLRLTQALRVGDPLASETQMGPLIHERRIVAMQAMVDEAVARGARLLCGGRRLGRAGCFYEPTVLEAAPGASRVQREEPFGPIALLDMFDEVDEAIERANALPYGLAAYAFTYDLRLAHQLATRLAAGMVGINHYGVSQPETPFGGIKDSGFGSENGLEGVLAYTDVKLVSVAS